MHLRTASKMMITAATVSALAFVGVPTASAETSTGWTGSTGLVGGTLYLTNSAVSNAPAPVATSTAWTVFGELITPGNAGILSRLFKSGILCEAQGYFYLAYPVNTYSVSTSGADCGPGSYNSHGLQRFYSGSSYVDHVTFPSSPLDFPAPGARSAEAPEPSINERGQTVGTAEGVENDADLPDLIAAQGSNGEVGYVKKTDLVAPELSKEQVLSLPQTTLADGTVAFHEPARTIAVYEEDGVTQTGTFTVG